jgi:rare lipoprotein A
VCRLNINAKAEIIKTSHRFGVFSLSMLTFMLLLPGCSTNKSAAPNPKPESATTANEPVKKGRYSLLDDQGPDVDIDVENIPNATPKKEDRTIAGNLSPYTVLGKTYNIQFNAAKYSEVGLASWYGKKFHGERTSNGEIYNMFAMTAAHKTLPIPCYVRVTNLANNKNVMLRINDRGPFHEDRIIDLTYTAAKKLDFHRAGTAKVRVDIVNMGDFTALPFVVVKSNAGNKMGGGLTNTQNPITAPFKKSASLKAPPPTELPTILAAAAVKPLAAEPKPVSAKVNNNLAAPVYLQVGAFAAEASAHELQKKLQTHTKYPVVLTPVEHKKIFRVLIGPFSNSTEIQALKQMLTEKNLSTPYVVEAAQVK